MIVTVIPGHGTLWLDLNAIYQFDKIICWGASQNRLYVKTFQSYHFHHGLASKNYYRYLVLTLWTPIVRSKSA